MNRYENYESSNQRAALGMAAVAMAAITIGLSLVVPAKTTTSSREAAALSKAVSPAADVVGGPLRVDVIAVREPSLASVQVRNVQAKHRQPG